MTLDELMRRYGAPGRIVFRLGHCGYPEVVLANKYGVAVVSLLGANVLSYRPTGHAEVLFRPARRNYARGDSFHGGVPVCFPQFGKLTIPGMRQHGFARLMPFEVSASSYSDEMTEITLRLRSDDATRSVWPHDFELLYHITVSMKLNLRLVVKNTGKEPFAFTDGLHPYFLIRDRETAVVRGLDGLKCVRSQDGSTRVQEGDYAIVSSSDAFALSAAPRHEFVVFDAALNRALALVASGITTAVVWNPGVEQPLDDLAENEWRRFVCVEPVSAWPKSERDLAPGETHELMAAIQATVNEPNPT